MKKLIILLLMFNTVEGQVKNDKKSKVKQQKSYDVLDYDNSDPIKYYIVGDSMYRAIVIDGDTSYVTKIPIGGTGRVADYLLYDTLKTDTIKCFFQVNDTTKGYMRGYPIDTLVFRIINPLTYGMYGYSVRERGGIYILSYLDLDKRPLKNIVVWQAIEVK